MEDYFTHRNSGHRYLLQKIDDSKDIQLVDGNGLADEQHTQIMRLYPHGFSSHSIKDSHFLSIGLGGRRDLLIALGGEHHEKRPKNLPEGDTILYNAEGDAIRMFGKKTLDITHSKNIKISIGQGLKDSSSSSSGGGSGASGGGGSGSDSGSKGKEAEAGKDKDVTIVVTENDITLTKGDTIVKLTADSLLCQGAKDAAIGTKGGKFVRVRPGRVDLGVDSPTDEATPAVMTDAGPSTIVFAKV